MKDTTTVVIGAGPYGLSTAAYLRAKGVPTLVLGKPMEFWQKMPAGMYLKSVLSASTLFDPAESYSLRRFAQATQTPIEEPLSLPLFLSYGRWFQQQAVPEVDPVYVHALSRDGSRFLLELTDGRTIQAPRVVVAVGISRFAYLPEFARGLPASLVSHTQDHTKFTPFCGKQVVVVGRGQSALESAALLHEAGAQVELIARGPVIWINRVLYDRTGPARHLFYPPSDVGPPGLNWLIAFPLLFRRLSEDLRHRLDKRAVRPAGAQWLRSRVEGCVQITPNTRILRVEEQGEKVGLTLSDGTSRQVDHLLLGTGYRPDLEKLEFLDANLRQQIQARDGYPLLNEWFESSIPNLHFVGAVANKSFGPICRFVTGARVAAQQVTRYALRGV
jgi:thioredoxin reductase